MFVLRECVFLLLLEYVTCFQFKITSKEETFLDLSLDIAQNTSITRCLKNFSSTETLGNKNKFYCDHCSTLQEAQKRFDFIGFRPLLIISSCSNFHQGKESVFLSGTTINGTKKKTE
eukprot:TRINITY_DN2633_c0_g1_i12.p2 TRINITY_DN2633_c0_g1~~TRINITY_DN2633_c0_g1_i12.p2  ORF type:complete len:117 (+),score=14.80 TRINITY_DN2633_c0_g1_i12:348-698(+)